MKTVEELLKPRWKVIADFPFNTYYKVGGVITDDRLMAARNENGHAVFACEWNDYPNIFRKLEWWEERKVEDMPKYLKQTGMVDGADNPLPDWVVKVKKHFNAGNGEWRDDSMNIFCIEKCIMTIGTSMSYSGFEPATEQEYIDYIEKQKQL